MKDNIRCLDPVMKYQKNLISKVMVIGTENLFMIHGFILIAVNIMKQNVINIITARNVGNGSTGSMKNKKGETANVD